MLQTRLEWWNRRRYQVCVFDQDKKCGFVFQIVYGVQFNNLFV